MWMADGQVRGLLAGQPQPLLQMLGDPDKENAKRVLQAMYKMKKIFIADLERLRG